MPAATASFSEKHVLAQQVARQIPQLLYLWNLLKQFKNSLYYLIIILLYQGIPSPIVLKAVWVKAAAGREMQTNHYP
jgi:hypothetical protein